MNQEVFKNDDLTITQLEDDMWVVETTDNTTMYIIEGAEKAILIDTGTKCSQLDSIVGLITKKPLYVVITHWHPDHDGNVKYFDEIYIHPADTVLFGKMNASYSGVIHFVEDGDIFDLGGKTIEVKLMPGHTPGSIILLDHEGGNAYTGDAFGSGQVWCQLWPFTPIKEYANSCNKMLRIMDTGISKIYCGHYPYIKRAYDKLYIQDMYNLAVMIDEGTQPDPEPHPVKIPELGATNPMMSTLGSATIVYNPEYIKTVNN